MAPHPVPPEAASETRLRVIGLLGGLARGASARGRILAVDTLLAALQRSPRSFGRSVTDEELRRWVQQDLTAVAELQAAASGPDPLVRIRVRDGLRNVDAGYDRSVARAARAAADASGDSDEIALYRAWSGAAPRRSTKSRRDATRRPRARPYRQAYMRRVARWLAGGRRAAEVVVHLEAAERAYAAARLDSRPDDLLEALCSVAPDLAVEVAREIAGSGSLLAGRVGALLNGIGKVRRRSYRVLLGEFAHGVGDALKSAAGALDRAAYERKWTAEEADLAHVLAEDGDAVVRGHMLHAVAAGSVEAELALAVLSAVSVGRDLYLGELFAAAADVILGRGGEIVDRGTAASLLLRLAGVPRFR